MISALLKLPSCRASLQDAPLAWPLPGLSGPSSPVTWALIPFSKPSRTKYHSYKSLYTEFISGNLQPMAIQSGLDQLKITYGSLPRHSSMWGQLIHRNFDGIIVIVAVDSSSIQMVALTTWHSISIAASAAFVIAALVVRISHIRHHARGTIALVMSIVI